MSYSEEEYPSDFEGELEHMMIEEPAAAPAPAKKPRAKRVNKIVDEPVTAIPVAPKKRTVKPKAAPVAAVVSADEDIAIKRRAFLSNPSVNPFTNRAIKYMSPKYIELCRIFGKPTA